jgi:single-stranded DNA-binding protein
MSDLNHCVVTGTLKYDPAVKFSDAGAQQVTLTIDCLELGPAGGVFNLWVPVECYGELAQVAGALHVGDSVLISGKLKYRTTVDRTGAKKSGLCVLARLVKVLAPAGQAVPA